MLLHKQRDSFESGVSTEHPGQELEVEQETISYSLTNDRHSFLQALIPFHRTPAICLRKTGFQVGRTADLKGASFLFQTPD